MSKVLRFFSELKGHFTNRNRRTRKLNSQLPKFILFCAIFLVFGTLSVLEFRQQVSKQTNAAVKEGQLVLVSLENSKVLAGVTTGEEIINNQPEANNEPKPNYRVNNLSASDVNKPKIALVITDLGLNDVATSLAMEQEKIFTLGFSAYANNIGELLDQSTSSGFETYLQIPVQSVDHPLINSGSYALMQNLSIVENLTRLDWVMSRSDKIAGFYTSVNDVFSTSKTNILPVLERLKAKNKIFLYGNAANSENIKDLASLIQLEYLPVNCLIDDKFNEKAMLSNLEFLRTKALMNGAAIGYLRPHPLSIQTVKKWLENADRNSFVIVSVSDLLKPLPVAEVNNVSGANDAKR